MIAIAQFDIAGMPATKGSSRAMMMRRKDKSPVAVLVPSGSSSNARALHAWDRAVKDAGERGCRLTGKFAGPVAVAVTFWMPRPQAHYRTTKAGTRVLRDDAPTWHVAKRGDVDKLARATLDSLTGIAWTDDGQVCRLDACKRFAPMGASGECFVGATIRISTCER